MNKILSSKKIIVAFFVGSFICIAAIILFFFNSKEIKEPITFEYDVKTCIVTFQVDSKYELTNIQLHYNDVIAPSYDSDKQTILFSVFELGEGKSEFFSFQYEKKGDNDKAVDNVTYEVIRGSDNVVITQYKHNIQKKSWSYYNTGT